MATVTFTTRANLVGGQPENIADVTDCLDKLLAGVNTIDTAQLAAGGVTPAKLSTGAKTSAGFASPTAGTTVLTGSPGAWTDMPGLTTTITPTVASIAIIDFSVLFQLLGGAAGFNAWGEARLSVDAVDVGAHGRAQVAGNAETVVIPAVGAVQAALSAAAHTVKVQVRSELQDAGSTIWALGTSGYLKWLMYAS